MNRSYKSNKREKPVSPLMVYWRRLDKPLILAALLCSVLSIILLYSSGSGSCMLRWHWCSRC